MKILLVEDGSIDLDALEENGLQDGKILVYRQGSHPPFLMDLPDSYNHENNNNQNIINDLIDIQKYVREIRENNKFNSNYNIFTDIIFYVEGILKKYKE